MRRVGDLDDALQVSQILGGAYEPDPGAALDLASCIGASWIYNGHKGTLEALGRMVQPGGLVLVGEPLWRTEPDPDYLKQIGQAANLCGSHRSNVQTGVDLGLSLLYAVVSSEDDWDRYEGLQWQAAEPAWLPEQIHGPAKAVPSPSQVGVSILVRGLQQLLHVRVVGMSSRVAIRP